MSTPTPTPNPTPTPTPTPAHPSPIFAPTPDQHDLALRELTDPTQSLCDVADTLKSTVSALSLWMAKPEIAAQLDAVDSAAARQARSCATHHLPRAVDALVMILQSYTGHERTSLPKPGTPAFENLRHHREGARRAAALLHRIANFHPGPPRGAGPSGPRASSLSRSSGRVDSLRVGEGSVSSSPFNAQEPRATTTAPASERPPPASASAPLTSSPTHPITSSSPLTSPPAHLPTSPSPLPSSPISSIADHERRIKNLLALRQLMHNMAPAKKPPASPLLPLDTLRAMIDAANPPEDDDDPDLDDNLNDEFDEDPHEDPHENQDDDNPEPTPEPTGFFELPPPGAFILDPTLPRDPDLIFEDNPPPDS